MPRRVCLLFVCYDFNVAWLMGKNLADGEIVRVASGLMVGNDPHYSVERADRRAITALRRGVTLQRTAQPALSNPWRVERRLMGCRPNTMIG
jgi:hypothetical protein